MTTDQKEEERKAIQLEVKARQELLRRLEHPTKLLKTAGDKERIRREERVTQAHEYKTIDEAQEAYGWGYLSDDEYHAIKEAIESGEEYIENTISPVELAAKLLSDFTGRISSEIRSLEFELLPLEEQIMRMEAAEKRREEIAERQAVRRGVQEEEKE